MLSVPVVVSAAVASSTLPATVSEAAGTLALICAFTNAVVANCVVFVPVGAVGAAGVSVNVGEASGAFSANASNTASWLGADVVTPLVMVCATKFAVAVRTNSVVAIWVVFDPAVAVGAVGAPVKAGDAKGAFVFSSLPNASNTVSVAATAPVVAVLKPVSGVARTRGSVKYRLVVPSVRLSVLALAVAPGATPSSLVLSVADMKPATLVVAALCAVPPLPTWLSGA